LYNGNHAPSQHQQAIIKSIEKQKEFETGRKLCDSLMELTRKKAEALLLKTHEEAARDAEQVRLIAQQEGYQQGYDEGREEARKESELLKKAQLDLMNDHQRLFADLYEAYRQKKEGLLDNLEADVVKIISMVIEKVLREKIEEDPSTLVRTVREAVLFLDKSQKIVIRLNPHEYNQLGKDYFINYITLPDVDIREDERVDVHGFIIESEFGMVDGQISSQIDMIRSLLFEKVSERYKDEEERE
jgi:flagellar assembly protein FliH